MTSGNIGPGLDLLAPCAEALRSHRARQNADRLAADARWVATDLVFTTGHGTPIEPRTVNRRFATLCVATEARPIRVHDLRHGCVSLQFFCRSVYRHAR